LDNVARSAIAASNGERDEYTVQVRPFASQDRPLDGDVTFARPTRRVELAEQVTASAECCDRGDPECRGARSDRERACASDDEGHREELEPLAPDVGEPAERTGDRGGAGETGAAGRWSVIELCSPLRDLHGRIVDWRGAGVNP